MKNKAIATALTASTAMLVVTPTTTAFASTMPETHQTVKVDNSTTKTKEVVNNKTNSEMSKSSEHEISGTITLGKKTSTEKQDNDKELKTQNSNVGKTKVVNHDNQKQQKQVVTKNDNQQVVNRVNNTIQPVKHTTNTVVNKERNVNHDPSRVSHNVVKNVTINNKTVPISSLGHTTGDGNVHYSPKVVKALHLKTVRLFKGTGSNNNANPNDGGMFLDINSAPGKTGFASATNEKLYEWLLNPANQAKAMNEAIALHGGNPVDTCVFFQSSALRAIGVPIPDSVGYTTVLEQHLKDLGWTRHTDFNNIQKGDICFASYYHTFCFMGWENKAEGIAYVMGNESYSYGTSYSHRDLNGQTGGNFQYAATCYWTAPGTPISGNGSGAPQNSQPNFIGKVKVTSPIGLWMNYGASANSGGITVLPYNTIVKVISKQNGWYKVQYDGMTGWIDGQYAQWLGPVAERGTGGGITQNPSSNNITSTPVSGTVKVNANGGLWLNKQPDVNKGNEVVIPNGTTLHVTALSSNGWYKTSYKDLTGWVYKPYLTNINVNKINNKQQNSSSNVSGSTVVTTATWLCLNKYPKPNDDILDYLPNGTKLKVLGSNGNGWLKVNYKGTIGWVGAKYTKALNNQSPNNNQQQVPQQQQKQNNNNGISVDQQVIINSPVGLNVRNSSSTNGSIIGVLGYNQVVTITGESNGWYRINYNGQTGWIDSSYTSTTGQSPSNVSNVNETATVNSPIGEWMLQGPYLQAGKIEALQYGTQVNIVGQSGNWSKVNYNGQIGWMYSQYLSIQ